MRGQMKPLISVIIPAYNAVEEMQRTVRSLINQSLPADQFEVMLIADDLHNYNAIDFHGLNIQLLRTNAPASGVSAARNIGIKASTASSICYLDAGDRYSENRLELFVDALKLAPLACDLPTIIDPVNGIIEPVYPEHDSMSLEELLASNIPVQIAHHKDERLLFAESVRFAEDTLLNAFAICCFNQPMVVVKGTKYFYHLSQGSLTDGDFETIDAGYAAVITHLKQSVIPSSDEKIMMHKAFWAKRQLNRLYFQFCESFGQCSFYSFANFIGLKS